MHPRSGLLPLQAVGDDVEEAQAKERWVAQPSVDPTWWTQLSFQDEPMAAVLRRRDVSKVLRFLRSRGFSRAALAALTGLTETRVRAIANGQQQIVAYDVFERVADGLRIPRHLMGLAYHPVGTQAQPAHSLSGWFRLSDSGLQTRPGRYFDATTIDVQRHVIHLSADGTAHVALGQQRRGLIVAVTEHLPKTFVIDARQANKRRIGSDATVCVPQPYEMDDLTLGLLWATIAMDDALINDDASLSTSRTQLAALRPLTRSAASHDLVDDLSSASRMWLGSQFCAEHIIGRLAAMRQVPMFFTREQRGEEASTWLLFLHKYQYLQRLAASMPAQATTRTFCVPAAAVSDSAPAERVLLMLVAALMESFGVRVEVSLEPAHATFDGFVLDRGGRAIVATWIGADAAWYVDVTDHPATIREYTDAIDDAHRQGVLAANSPGERLRRLCDYLDLPWSWLISRCAAFSEVGSAGLYTPRSRLLSVAGIDRACGFLGDFTHNRL